MSEMLNIEAIYRQEGQRWMKENALWKSIREMIAESVPYRIILAVLVLSGLSAPHTAGVFDKLTPGWGWLAPIGIEFGLLYTAFRRRRTNVTKQPLPWTLWALEILLFLTTMLGNGAGSFTSVVTASQLGNLSFTAIVERVGQLPAASQAALIMAVLSALGVINVNSSNNSIILATDELSFDQARLSDVLREHGESQFTIFDTHAVQLLVGTL